MVKKIVMLVCSLLICVLFVPSIDVNAEEDIFAEGHTFYTNYPEPAKSETQGYVHILLYNQDTRNYYMVTYFWTISSSQSEGIPTGCQGMVTLTDTSFEFNIQAQNNTTGIFYTLYHINATGDYRCVMATSSQKYKRNWDEIYQGDVSLIGWKAGGNAYVLGGNFNTDFTVYYSDDGSSRLLMDILDYMHTINSQNILSSHDLWTQLSYILNEAESIDDQIVDILDYLERYETKLDAYSDDFEYLKKRADRMVAMQKETNTWLEKIYNYFNESKEEEKQEITTQGGNSVSQGSDSIENSGQGFGDSLGGLVSSMSYSGTECSWTFPEVRLPAINGVMDEIVLIEEQPIDFGVWVDAIPSNILLLIRSVLTGALIIYCFKELYGTISYVLTLKGSGVNE